MNLHNRSFHHGWLKTYRWLVYSKSQDGGYCLPCVLFSPGSQTAGNRGVLVRTPFKCWTKVSDVCCGHEQLKYHLDAQVAFEEFKSTMIRCEKSVASQHDGQRAEQLRKNQELIKSVAKTVHFAENRALLFGVIETTAQRPPQATEATSESSWISVLRLVTSICKTTLSQGKEMPCTAARRSKIN